MNNVSSLIYWAEVLGNLQILWVCLIVLFVLLSIISFTASMHYVDEANDKDGKKWKGFFKAFVVFAVLLSLSSIARIFTPSQSTMLAIAASEATGSVITSPESKKLLDTLQKTLEKNLTK